MCLYYDAEVDKKFKQRNRNKKFVWAIKAYQIIRYNAELIPLYYGPHITKCGWVISDRRYKKLKKSLSEKSHHKKNQKNEKVRLK